MLAEIDLDQIVFEAYREIRPKLPVWTPEEIQFVRDHLQDMTFEEIGAALGRSPEAIKIVQVKKRMPAPSKHPGFLTGNGAADALGVDIHSITRLVQRGLFPANHLPGKRQILMISQRRLYMWAINPRHWMYFRVQRMRDQHLKRLVIRAQERWGDRWVPIGEAAKISTICHGALNRRIHEGRFMAEDVVHYGNWWIKELAVRGLVVHPNRYFRDGMNYFPPAADEFIRRAHAQGLSYEATGRMMKWSDFRVISRLVAMGLIEPPAYFQKRYIEKERFYGNG